MQGSTVNDLKARAGGKTACETVASIMVRHHGMTHLKSNRLLDPSRGQGKSNGKGYNVNR